MCKFCENIVVESEWLNERVKSEDFIYKDDDSYGILIDTGDSGCLGNLENISYCPYCGRKLNDAELMSGKIDHPSHYNKTGRKECIVEMHEKYGLFKTSVFCLLNTYKYLYRAGEKDGNSREQDLKKALWYYDWVIRETTNASGNMILDTELFKDVNKMIMEMDFESNN